MDSSPAAEQTNALGFEQALRHLETVVRELEEGQIDLSVALARYEEGIKLLRRCHSLLEQAERRIELLVGVDAAGNPVTQPFNDPQGDSPCEAAAPQRRRRTASSAKTSLSEPPKPASEVPGST